MQDGAHVDWTEGEGAWVEDLREKRAGTHHGSLYGA